MKEIYRTDSGVDWLVCLGFGVGCFKLSDILDGEGFKSHQKNPEIISKPLRGSHGVHTTSKAFFPLKIHEWHTAMSKQPPWTLESQRTYYSAPHNNTKEHQSPKIHSEHVDSQSLFFINIKSHKPKCHGHCLTYIINYPIQKINLLLLVSFLNQQWIMNI